MKTVLQEVLEDINQSWENGHPPFTRFELQVLIEGYIAGEREQICRAFRVGCYTSTESIDETKERAQEYYERHYMTDENDETY